MSSSGTLKRRITLICKRELQENKLFTLHDVTKSEQQGQLKFKIIIVLLNPTRHTSGRTTGSTGNEVTIQTQDIYRKKLSSVLQCYRNKWETGFDSCAHLCGLIVGSRTANLQRTTISSHILAQAWAATSDWPLLRPVCPLALLCDADVRTLYHQPVICRRKCSVEVRCGQQLIPCSHLTS